MVASIQVHFTLHDIHALLMTCVVCLVSKQAMSVKPFGVTIFRLVCWTSKRIQVQNTVSALKGNWKPEGWELLAYGQSTRYEFMSLEEHIVTLWLRYFNFNIWIFCVQNLCILSVHLTLCTSVQYSFCNMIHCWTYKRHAY